mmetsp:Transcript_88699/g.251412  ORF Transcript_88699/g.251412 Transcript_88699/m.251412 type:complete len:215 (-) Transcript_88699:15-659(-)
MPCTTTNNSYFGKRSNRSLTIPLSSGVVSQCLHPSWCSLTTLHSHPFQLASPWPVSSATSRVCRWTASSFCGCQASFRSTAVQHARPALGSHRVAPCAPCRTAPTRLRRQRRRQAWASAPHAVARRRKAGAPSCWRQTWLGPAPGLPQELLQRLFRQAPVAGWAGAAGGIGPGLRAGLAGRAPAAPATPVTLAAGGANPVESLHPAQAGRWGQP